MSNAAPSKGELVLYQTEDGLTQIQLRALDGTVWLTQIEIAELFATTKQAVSYHVNNVLEEREATAAATVKEYLTVRSEGEREVRRKVKLYNLEMIIAIGYRVRSPRGTQFRQWATTRLKEYLIKGFAIDEKRLAEPGPFDYFDELLEKVARFALRRSVFTRKCAISIKRP